MNIEIKNWKDTEKTGKRDKCLHDSCPNCNGLGRKKSGEMCVHMISCPCKRCSPVYLG